MYSGFLSLSISRADLLSLARPVISSPTCDTGSTHGHKHQCPAFLEWKCAGTHIHSPHPRHVSHGMRSGLRDMESHPAGHVYRQDKTLLLVDPGHPRRTERTMGSSTSDLALHSSTYTYICIILVIIILQSRTAILQYAETRIKLTGRHYRKISISTEITVRHVPDPNPRERLYSEREEWYREKKKAKAQQVRGGWWVVRRLGRLPAVVVDQRVCTTIDVSSTQGPSMSSVSMQDTPARSSPPIA